jgi:hypothetical protein
MSEDEPDRPAPDPPGGNPTEHQPLGPPDQQPLGPPEHGPLGPPEHLPLGPPEHEGRWGPVMSAPRNLIRWFAGLFGRGA